MLQITEILTIRLKNFKSDRRKTIRVNTKVLSLKNQLRITRLPRDASAYQHFFKKQKLIWVGSCKSTCFLPLCYVVESVISKVKFGQQSGHAAKKLANDSVKAKLKNTHTHKLIDFISSAQLTLLP